MFDESVKVGYIYLNGAARGCQLTKGYHIMAITTIDYRAATCNMGESTEQDGDNYRVWAKEQIEARYPDADIDVLDEDRPSTCSNDEYDDNEEIECLEFLAGLWDVCPWTGEHFK